MLSYATLILTCVPLRRNRGPDPSDPALVASRSAPAIDSKSARGMPTSELAGDVRRASVLAAASPVRRNSIAGLPTTSPQVVDTWWSNTRRIWSTPGTNAFEAYRPAAFAEAASTGVSWKYVVMNTALSVFVSTSPRRSEKSHPLSSYVHDAEYV